MSKHGDWEWHSRERKYDREKKAKALYKEEVSNHPLKGITITVTEGRTRKHHGKSSRSSSVSSERRVSSSGGGSSTVMMDPLSSTVEASDPLSMMAAEATDPLSKMAAGLSISDNKSDKRQQDVSCNDMDESFEPWLSRKSAILNRYTTSEKLSITTSFLSGGEKVIVRSQATTVSDKVKNRLEQLDDFEEGSVQEMLNLSQQEYVNRIDELNNALISAWDQDQRVKALKIVIQCSKLLGDVSVIQFYPSKFVLVTDILDTFGRLVFDRIKSKSVYLPKGATSPIQLPENFTPEQVPESAKETCRNWFFKIASIRELIPRFYVEVAILKSYSFLQKREYNQALQRLAVMTRGIGDPLVSIYARCYLCRVGVSVAPKITDHHLPCFDDFIKSYCQVQSDSVQNTLAIQGVEMARYLTLYSPALDWLLQCVAHRASDSVLDEILTKCKEECNNALLLNSIMSAFKPEYVGARALQFTELIKECEESGFPKHVLYRSLGMCLVLSDPPEDQKLLVLNEVWKIVVKLKDPADYMSCAEIWIEFVAKHFTKREVNTILNDIIKHLTPDRAYEDFYPQLQSIVAKILAHIHDFALLFALEKFMPFLDMFQKDSVKVDMCKTIVDSFVRSQIEPTCDPVILNALTFVCKTMHDSVNALTLEDEVRAIGNLTNGFIRSISFGRDFEQQLSFYVEARANFSNIEQVIVYLVQSVNNLAVKTRDIMKGNHSRKTASFVRACAAYSFITIPSLTGAFSRLTLYLSSGQVALMNQCLSQGDAFFKAAVSLLPEVPRTVVMDGKMRSSDSLILEYTNNFISSLLILPDSPDQGVLCLVRGLLNVIQGSSWDTRPDARILLYINMLAMFGAASQEIYIYHIDKVDSNDTLYGHDPKFLGEVNKICNTLLKEILTYLKSLEKPETQKRQASMALELFNRVVAHGDLNHMSELAVNLWNMVQKHGQLDHRLMGRTLDHVKRLAAEYPQDKSYSYLVNSMPLQSRA